MIEFLGLAIGLLILSVLAFFALMIFSFVFWILMIVDIAKRKFPKDNDQIMWILIVIFTGIIGALIYYFIVKRQK